MSYDSNINLLTIYGAGVRDIVKKGLNLEQAIEQLINHEILHDIIYQLEDLTKYDVFKQHWPFYWGIDLLNGDYFTTMLEKCNCDTPLSSNLINSILEF
jgi:hypothetical protein